MAGSAAEARTPARDLVLLSVVAMSTFLRLLAGTKFIARLMFPDAKSPVELCLILIDPGTEVVDLPSVSVLKRADPFESGSRLTTASMAREVGPRWSSVRNAPRSNKS